MGMKPLYQAIAAAVALLIPSCAYMQTHKNVEELGKVYQGSLLEKGGMSLHSRGGQWYIGAPATKLQKRYPIIHDSVLLTGDNEPTYRAVSSGNTQQQTYYFPISSGTATCLMRDDGYANLADLAEEIRSSRTAPLSALPGSTRHAIRAQLHAPKGSVPLINEQNMPRTGLVNQALSKVDFALVDIPGTIVYNVAIPFMAPFVFFSDFTDEASDFQ